MAEVYLGPFQNQNIVLILKPHIFIVIQQVSMKLNNSNNKFLKTSILP